VAPPISLKQPKLRHDRAGEHLADIETMVKTVRSEHKIAIRQGDPDPPESVEIPAGIGDRLSVRIGEHIYNLRAALDYLIYELSGHKRQTQFPVEKDRNSFNSRKTGHNAAGKDVARYLHGVSTDHCRLIESVQPYVLAPGDPDPRSSWTGLLQCLSNEDKHRQVVPLNGRTGQPITRQQVRQYPVVTVHPHYGGGGRVFLRIITPPRTYVEIQVDFPVEVALPQGLPAYQALQELQTEVGALLALVERSL